MSRIEVKAVYIDDKLGLVFEDADGNLHSPYIFNASGYVPLLNVERLDEAQPKEQQ